MHRERPIIFKQDCKPFFPLIIPGQGTPTGVAGAVWMKPDTVTCAECIIDGGDEYGGEWTEPHEISSLLRGILFVLQ